MAQEKKKRKRPGPANTHPSGEAAAPARIARPRPGERKSTAAAAKAEAMGSEPAKAPATDSAAPAVQERKPVFVVGIGASAGGLESFENFFRNMPPDTGMAFILVSHLEPTHVSMLPELLQRSSKMPVQQVRDGMLVEPDHVYVIPPDCDLGLMNGTIQLFKQRKGNPTRAPIDYFFRSLALDQREKAIAIVLSGMGSDGTLGSRAVKGEMGMVMAQAPESAKFSGMPDSVIGTGLVDYILPPGEMPARLLQYAQQGGRLLVREPALVGKTPDGLNKIFYLIRSVTGHDLSCYKRSTIVRRLERRMKVHQIDSLPHYVRYLQSNRHEVETLFKEILINVTSFFRDREAFAIIEQKALPHLLGIRNSGDPVRIWVPGCSTGEEAYSLAILIREYMLDHSKNFKVQIFGTDIDRDAIETARSCLYPSLVAADIGPERLERFFERENGSFRVRKEIREMLVFAPQDIIKDPPFTRLDLISCRNLLIYLENDLQKKLLPLFHYSLKPGGVLFLGSSESAGEFADLFGIVDKKWRVFVRKGSSTTDRPILDFTLGASRKTGTDTMAPHGREPNLSQFVEGLLLKDYAPASVVINPKGDILYIHGRTGKFLEPAPGNANLNIVDMAREGLKLQLPSAIRHAVNQKKEVVCERVKVRTNGGSEAMTLTIRPITEPESMTDLLLVLLEEAKPAELAKAESETGIPSKKSGRRVRELEQELNATRENLQTTIEELETSNEELKSMNEECQSTNEELKSANEELETSREELQSLNEELSTVNAELQEKIERLSRSHRDIKDYLDSIEVPTIFLDDKLCIKRFNSYAERVVNLIQGDVGRPIGHLVPKFRFDGLAEEAARVQRSMRPFEREVETNSGEWYQLRIIPYRASDNVLDGVVITFVDIQRMKQMSDEMLSAREMFDQIESILDMTFEPTLVLGPDWRVLSANSAFLRAFGSRRDSIAGRKLFEIEKNRWDIPVLRTLLEKRLPLRETADTVSVDLPWCGAGFQVRARRLDGSKPSSMKVVLVFQPEPERSATP